MPGNLSRRTDGRTDGHAVKRLRLVGWTNGPMYRSKEGISGFGRTDGQPENIMPPAPKGGGITNYTIFNFKCISAQQIKENTFNFQLHSYVRMKYTACFADIH